MKLLLMSVVLLLGRV